jgi:molybdate transport system regulatory protein
MASLSIRLDFGPDLRIGPGKIRLLELVAEHGSISAAGRALDMSYRRAWLLLDELNRAFPEPVIDTVRGGRTGGGAALTATGQRLVDAYHRIARDAAKAAAPHLDAIRPKGSCGSEASA